VKERKNLNRHLLEQVDVKQNGGRQHEVVAADPPSSAERDQARHPVVSWTTTT